MFKKAIIIYFTFHFLLGALLPTNDFDFLAQIPTIYNDFQKINGKTDFAEFLEEQFFDVEKWLNLEEDSDEKEQIPVNFHYHFSNFVLFTIYFPSQFKFTTSYFFFTSKPIISDKFNLIDSFLSSIFRPPQIFC